MNEIKESELKEIFVKTLNDMQISDNIITELLNLNNFQNTQHWKNIFQQIEILSRDEKEQFLRNLVNMKQKSSESTSSAPYSFKYTELKKNALNTFQKNSSFECSIKSSGKSSRNDEWDSNAGCSENAFYVCHHCHQNFCSSHTYWIPDKEFPYLVKKPNRIQVNYADPQKIENFKKKSNNYQILGLCTICFLIGIYFLIMANKYKKIAADLKKMRQISDSTLYPEYAKEVSTKWNSLYLETFEHRGYYTAVHCWDCLKNFHPEYVNISTQILNMVFQQSLSWNQTLNNEIMGLSDNQRVKCANYAANLYLNDFKFGKQALLPINNYLKILERPKMYAKSIGPTPIWLFTPYSNNKTGYITIDQWLHQKTPSIQNQVLSQYNPSNGKISTKITQGQLTVIGTRNIQQSYNIQNPQNSGYNNSTEQIPPTDISGRNQSPNNDFKMKIKETMTKWVRFVDRTNHLKIILLIVAIVFIVLTVSFFALRGFYVQSLSDCMNSTSIYYWANCHNYYDSEILLFGVLGTIFLILSIIVIFLNIIYYVGKQSMIHKNLTF